ncbi:acyltransferase family protein [Dorea sp.]
MACYLLFYLFIPFLNKLIGALTEKEHLLLVGLFLFIYTFLPSFVLAKVSFNYVTWFIILYLLAAYLRIYEKHWFKNTKLWMWLTIGSLVLSWMSVIILTYLGKRLGYQGLSYFFVNDCNKILALTTAVFAFMFFKNVYILQSNFINKVAASTLGVLLIHANSDTMRQWLWVDFLKNTAYFESSFLIIHAVGSVLGIYVVCTVIDQLRIKYVEMPIVSWMENKKK